MLDGPHAGYAMMTPTAVGGLISAQPRQRLEVMHADTFERFIVEVVDVVAKSARHVDGAGTSGRAG